MPTPSELEGPREIAARTLCELEGIPADVLYESKFVWVSYLEEVDVILEAVGWRPGAEVSLTGNPKSARELAAHALCRFDGHPEDTKFEGRPMWESYLPQADAVLEAIKREPEDNDDPRPT